jgi:hypothetical protein
MAKKRNKNNNQNKEVSILQQLKELEEIEDGLLNKALLSNDPETLLKANMLFTKKQTSNQSSNSDIQRKSLLLDPFQLYDTLGFKDKAHAVTYDTLRNMAKSPIIKSIIETRIEQVAAYSHPQPENRKAGWMIRRKLYNDATYTEKQQEIDRRISDNITEFLLNGGSLGCNWNSDDFDTFLRKITRDSLVLDQMTYEVVRDRQDIPVEFFATDGATYRLSDSLTAANVDRIITKSGIQYYPKYVQYIQGTIYEQFYPWELCFGIRNHNTKLLTAGYGRSELEDMIRIVTWMLYSDQYNGNFFSQGAAPKGIIRLQGNVNSDRLAEFKQQWKAQIAGVQNAWKTPVLEADKMDFINLQMSNADMQFGHWQEYLIRLTCAMYKIDPVEIGFLQGSGGNSQSMFETSQQVRIKYSQERGLIPLLKFVQSKINKYLVSQLNSDFEFIFTGLEGEDEKAELAADIQKLGNFMTLKEIRRKRGLPEEIEDDDWILNPIYFQVKMQQQQGMGEEDMYGGMPEPGEEEENPFLKSFNNYIEKELVHENK